MYDEVFKVVIFGDAGSGKTTLAKRYMTNLFVSNSNMTIGVEFLSKSVKLNGKIVKLMLWDFGGEERFRFIFPHYIAGAKGGILMYDITQVSSFSHLSDWLNVVNGAKNRFPIILVGSKLDLENHREISQSEGREFSKYLKLNSFIECSSKTGENVEKSFELLTKLMINRK